MKKHLVAGASLLAGVLSATSVMAADMPVKAAYKAPSVENLQLDRVLCRRHSRLRID
jgi:hypothetical protein